MAQFSCPVPAEESFSLRRNLLLAMVLGLAVAWAGGIALGSSMQSRSWTEELVERRLDSEAKSFHSLTADVERTKATVVVGDYSTESGQLYVRGDKMRIDLTQPDVKTVLRDGDKLYLYTPKLQRVEEYDLGKHRAEVDQFLLLGFGTPGRELAKSYQVRILGEPAIGNQKTLWLELTPKARKIADQISRIELWLDESSWVPVQQKFYEAGSQDYWMIRYSNIVRNSQIKDSVFKARWPPGTEKIKPRV